MNKFDVVCIGNAAVDVPLNYIDEKVFTTDSYAIDRILPTVGGSGTNVSTVLTHLGKKVKLITLLGNDLLGDYLVDHCRNTGIDVSHIVRRDTVDTPLSIGIVKPDGERNFIVSKSSSTFHFSADDVSLEALNNVQLLHFASIFIMPRFDCEGLSKIFRQAKKKGIIVCADMMKSRTGKRLDAIESALAYVDYFFANDEEASFLTSLAEDADISRRLMDCGVGNVVIKKGKRGCYIRNAEIEENCPAFLSEEVIDTIGAGDNFAAGFITGILDGLSFRDCARFANATASISVEAVGSTSGVKNKQQVLDLFSNHN